MLMISGDKYWVFEPNDDDKLSVKSSYPKSITNFKGIPSNLDDVLLVGRKVYFFKNGEYYRIGDYVLDFQVRYYCNCSIPIQKRRLFRLG